MGLPYLNRKEIGIRMRSEAKHHLARSDFSYNFGFSAFLLSTEIRMLTSKVKKYAESCKKIFVLRKSYIFELVC